MLLKKMTFIAMIKMKHMVQSKYIKWMTKRHIIIHFEINKAEAQPFG